MKTYEQGKKELDIELKRLNKEIKNAKQNITYELKCPSCNKVKSVRVYLAQNGLGRTYCSNSCRNKAYRIRKQIRTFKELGLAYEYIEELQQVVAMMKHEVEK